MDFKPQIETALGELSLIIDTDADENTFQQWFERNEIVFRCLGYKRVIPHPCLDLEVKQNDTYIPDFMAVNSSGIWEIIEIKPAKALIIKDSERRHTLRNSTESYLSQCAEYSNLFMDREYLKRFNSRYQADCHKTPDVTLIIGRSEGLDKRQLQGILAHRSMPHIAIKTFDDVRESVYQFAETAHDLPMTILPGMCIAFTAILLPCPDEKTTYILDVCKHDSSSRIQLYVNDGRLFLDVTDRNGKFCSINTTQSDYASALDKFSSFAIQISSNGEYSTIELLVEDKLLLETRQRGMVFDFTEQIEYVVGSDQSGCHPSSMLFGALVILQLIPLIEDRWLIREGLSEIANEQGERYFHEYIGHKFMHTPNHPQLGGITPFERCIMQGEDSKKPVLRARIIDPETLKIIPLLIP